LFKFKHESDQQLKFCIWVKNPNYLEETEEAKAILAGSYNFQSVEIEVFTHSDE